MSKLTCPLRMSAVRTTRLAMAHPGHQHDPQRDTRPWQVSRPTQPSTSAVRGGASLACVSLVSGRGLILIDLGFWIEGEDIPSLQSVDWLLSPESSSGRFGSENYLISERVTPPR